MVPSLVISKTQDREGACADHWRLCDGWELDLDSRGDVERFSFLFFVFHLILLLGRRTQRAYDGNSDGLIHCAGRDGIPSHFSPFLLFERDTLFSPFAFLRVLAGFFHTRIKSEGVLGAYTGRC
jgi:hypothetical protein